MDVMGGKITINLKELN